MRCTSRFSFEPLEDRRHLAGVTVIIHGHQGTINGWVSSAANAIADRIGESQTSQYVLKVGNDTGQLAVESFTLKSGPALAVSSKAEAVIKLDWTDVDDGSVSTERVGQVVGNYLLASHDSLPALAELPIHLIGHSRGASLAVSITKQLGRAGVWVDQATFLDAHPVEGFFGYGDTSMRVYDNVIFADNYYRDDGSAFNFDPDGQSVKGTHQLNLKNSVQKKHVISAHVAVTAYYHGTIDTDASTNNDHPIFSSWYDDSKDKPSRKKTGYVFSRIGGGERPKNGLIAAFGGTAVRNKTEASGVQWSNVGDLQISGGTTFTIGKKLSLNFLRQDRDSSGKVTVYLDKDQNPYNDNYERTMQKATISKTTDIKSSHLSAFSGGVDPGKYYIVLKTTDPAGHSRFTYSSKITFKS